MFVAGILQREDGYFSAGEFLAPGSRSFSYAL